MWVQDFINFYLSIDRIRIKLIRDIQDALRITWYFFCKNNELIQILRFISNGFSAVLNLHEFLFDCFDLSIQTNNCRSKIIRQHGFCHIHLLAHWLGYPQSYLVVDLYTLSLCKCYWWQNQIAEKQYEFLHNLNVNDDFSVTIKRGF